MSESLKARFPNENWTNGEPGNFIVIYTITNNRVTR